MNKRLADSASDKSQPAKANKNRLSILGLCQVVALFTVLLSIVTLFAAWHWVCELFSHFKLQYLASGILCSGVFLYYRQKWPAIVMVSVTMLNAWFVAPWYFVTDKTGHPDALAMRVVQFNVSTDNSQFGEVLDWLLAIEADLISLQEVNDDWSQALSGLENQYPYQLVIPREDNFGIAIYSRQPFTANSVMAFGPAQLPSLHLVQNFGGKQLNIFATHPPPPVSTPLIHQRNMQLAKLADYIRRTADNPTLLLGDLNTSMWGFHYRQFMARTRLVNARQGFGVLASWPSFLPLVRIPIDHVLLSPELYVRNLELGPALGSDHLPLVAEITFRK